MSAAPDEFQIKINTERAERQLELLHIAFEEMSDTFHDAATDLMQILKGLKQIREERKAEEAKEVFGE